MVRHEETVVIDRSVEDVFAYVADLRTHTQWQPDVEEVRRTTEEPLGVGTRFTSVRRFLGSKLTSEVVFTEYEPSQKFAFKSTAGLPHQVWNHFEPTANGTKMTMVTEMHPEGFLALAEPLLASQLRGGMKNSLAAMKALLEGHREKAAA